MSAPGTGQGETAVAGGPPRSHHLRPAEHEAAPHLTHLGHSLDTPWTHQPRDLVTMIQATLLLLVCLVSWPARAAAAGVVNIVNRIIFSRHGEIIIVNIPAGHRTKRQSLDDGGDGKQ